MNSNGAIHAGVFVPQPIWTMTATGRKLVTADTNLNGHGAPALRIYTDEQGNLSVSQASPAGAMVSPSSDRTAFFLLYKNYFAADFDGLRLF